MVEALLDEDRLPREALERLQREKLAGLLAEIRGRNAFYERKLAGVRFDPRTDPLEALPLTTREELQQDQRDHPPYGSNLTYPLGRYVRLHQSSGSQGLPLRWLDTAESWDWFRRCWLRVLRGAGATFEDRVFVPFSFGPFIGFWGAFESAASLGCLTMPGGGMSTSARIRFLMDNAATVVCCTPTYALHMAEVARVEGYPLAASAVRAVIVAGEPGGSVPAVRRQIEDAFGARVYDHAGMTECGAWGFERSEAPGVLLVLESEFIAECVDPQTLRPVPDGQPGELVLTNLGRAGSPVIRYRTGDQVCLRRSPSTAGCWLARAEGGVMGRLDDMLIIRGTNVFPSAIEGILREFAEVAEFRIEVGRREALAELRLVVELQPGAAREGLSERIGRTVRDRLSLRPVVELVEPGSLPRFELKARRVVRSEAPASPA